MQDKNFSAVLDSLSKEEKVNRLKRMAGKNEIVDYIMDPADENPSVYCGTYRKYNEGSIYGAWIDLKACGDYDTFIEVCHKLHADEEDPELMFQDFQYFPEGWYSESCMDKATFDKIIEYADMDDKEAFEAYMDATGDDDAEHFKFRYMGKWDSEEDFAEHIVDECYNLEEHGIIGRYFDYKAFARDLFLDGYSFYDGYVFSDC